jgi:hypothetical protein
MWLCFVTLYGKVIHMTAAGKSNYDDVGNSIC